MTLEEASNYFKLIADPNRLTILKLLTKKLRMSASEFLNEVSCKQATLSHHLNEMTNGGLLKSKKSGNKVFYSLDADKYNQLVNYLNKLDRINKNEEVCRVIDSKIIKKEEKKEPLPTYLL